VMNLAELRPTGANHGRTSGQGLIRNRASLVHRCPLLALKADLNATLVMPRFDRGSFGVLFTYPDIPIAR
jgi:hypothetical protein